MAANQFDTVAQIMAYEQGDLSSADSIALFQHLLDDGTVFHLQGTYGSTAQALMDEGLIHMTHRTQHRIH